MKSTDQLRKEIEALSIAFPLEERICMWAVSKDLRGDFTVGEQKPRDCESPGCVTLEALVNFDMKVASHQACDSPAAKAFDGNIRGRLLFALIDDGLGRGYHEGRLDWGGASSLIGQMSGMTNVGTHRSPAAGSEACDRGGHMEGRLDAVVVKGDHQGCRVLATYAIDYDSSHRFQETAVSGTLEGVLICQCKS